DFFATVTFTVIFYDRDEWEGRKVANLPQLVTSQERHILAPRGQLILVRGVLYGFLSGNNEFKSDGNRSALREI
ncbi:hypothetical protein GWI33_009441, partial [Rhynchophorus ferrugineus]